MNKWWMGNRLLLAARMFHRGLIKRLVCSGRGIEGLSVEGDGPTQQTEEIWRDLGIPKDRITRIDGRNTSEESKPGEKS